MNFAVGPACLHAIEAQHPTSVRVAGLDALSVGSFKPPQGFNGVGDEITRAYALPIGDRTLCVYATWHPTTSDADRAAALAIVDTIRAQPIGKDRIRVTFILRDRWDTG